MMDGEMNYRKEVRAAAICGFVAYAIIVFVTFDPLFFIDHEETMFSDNDARFGRLMWLFLSVWCFAGYKTWWATQ